MNNFPRVSLFEFEQNFDHYFSQVETGATFVITRDEKDAVIIMPYHNYENLIKGQATLSNIASDIDI